MNKDSIVLPGSSFEEVQFFTYLSSVIDQQDDTGADVKTRVRKDRATLIQQKFIKRPILYNINSILF
jgi:hypothetical protein